MVSPLCSRAKLAGGSHDFGFIPENAQRTGNKGLVSKEDTSIEDALIANTEFIFKEIEKTIVHHCDGECFDEIKLIFKRLK
jgi:hypothetical protein